MEFWEPTNRREDDGDVDHLELARELLLMGKPTGPQGPRLDPGRQCSCTWPSKWPRLPASSRAVWGAGGAAFLSRPGR